MTRVEDSLLSLWSRERRWTLWLTLEVYLAEELAADGLIPAEGASLLAQSAACLPDGILRERWGGSTEFSAFLIETSRHAADAGRWLHPPEGQVPVEEWACAIRLAETIEAIWEAVLGQGPEPPPWAAEWKSRLERLHADAVRVPPAPGSHASDQSPSWYERLATRVGLVVDNQTPRREARGMAAEALVVLALALSETISTRTGWKGWKRSTICPDSAVTATGEDLHSTGFDGDAELPGITDGVQISWRDSARRALSLARSTLELAERGNMDSTEDTYDAGWESTTLGGGFGLIADTLAMMALAASNPSLATGAEGQALSPAWLEYERSPLWGATTCRASSVQADRLLVRLRELGLPLPRALRAIQRSLVRAAQGSVPFAEQLTMEADVMAYLTGEDLESLLGDAPPPDPANVVTSAVPTD